MRVFALGDTHLGTAVDMPMDRFGEVWVQHPAKIARAWREDIGETDLVLITGDLSWARKIKDALPDLEFLASLPGRKVITKGNHDQWWDTTAKVTRLCPATLTPLLNGCLVVDRLAIAAVRGWDFPGSPDYRAETEKTYTKELGRLELALDCARERREQFDRLLVMMHYPPLIDPSGTHDPARAVLSEFVPRMVAAGVTTCVYSHVHGPSLCQVVEGDVGGIRFHCVSADWLNHAPRLILET